MTELPLGEGQLFNKEELKINLLQQVTALKIEVERLAQEYVQTGRDRTEFDEYLIKRVIEIEDIVNSGDTAMATEEIARLQESLPYYEVPPEYDEIRAKIEEIKSEVNLGSLEESDAETILRITKELRTIWKAHHKLQMFLRDDFQQFSDLLHIGRVLEIIKYYDPEQVDTIIGVDRSGRSYAKLISAAYSLIRQRLGLSKTKLIFINMHVIDMHYTDTDLNFANNSLFANKDYGTAVIIDDFTTGSYETQAALLRFIDKMSESEYNTNIKVRGYEYFLKQNSTRGENDPLLLLNKRLQPGGINYLHKGDGVLAIPFKEAENRQEEIKKINEDVTRISIIAAKIYEKEDKKVATDYSK